MKSSLKVVFVATPMAVDTKWGVPVVFETREDAERYKEEFNQDRENAHLRLDIEMCVMWVKE